MYILLNCTQNSTLAKAELIDQEAISSTLEENDEVLTMGKLDKELTLFLQFRNTEEVVPCSALSVFRNNFNYLRIFRLYNSNAVPY